MKWGRKKTSLFARVFSGSWFSKLMPKAVSFETDSLKNKQRSEMGYPTRFYSLDEDDAYWRMSFAEEQIQQGRRSTGGINPLWHDHHPPDHGFHDSVLGSKEKERLSRRDECLKFNDMVLDVRMTKERQDKKKILGDKYEDFSDPCSRMPSPGVCFNKQLKISSEDDEGGFPGSVSSWKYSVSTPIKKPDHNTRFGLSPVEENHVLEPPTEDALGRISFSEWQHMEDKRIQVRTDCQKKSAETKLHNNVRVRPYSPNTECKGGGAIDTMKKSRMKWKKKGRDDTAMGYSDTIFDSFAVVKTSSDPHRDFRDSMVDMIQEEGITRHEELEELLSCYLTLNSDEYHDLIIKVFQDVWLEMNGGCVSVHPTDNGKMFR